MGNMMDHMQIVMNLIIGTNHIQLFGFSTGNFDIEIQTYNIFILYYIDFFEVVLLNNLNAICFELIFFIKRFS